jgi:DNA-binding MarR family transcriptional regulator
MNEINKEFLLCALTDKKLTPNEFRLLVFISTFEIITTQAIIKNIGIKNPKTISTCINSLIEHEYIKRTSIKKQTNKGEAKYQYIINSNKRSNPNNINTQLNQEFKKPLEVYEYFFEKLPTNRPIAISDNRKAMYQLINEIHITPNKLIQIIDYIAENKDNYSNITRPTDLKKYINELKKLV